MSRSTVEQRLQVRRVGQRAVRRAGQRGPAGPGRGVHDRELDLLLGRVQVQEQLVGGVHHLGDPGVRPVHLVDHQDDRQVGFQRLAQHEPGLRQRALAGVHQQHHAVHHGQAALHLAAEVGVPRRVDDVDGQPAVRDRGVLGQDRDALLPLQVTGVQHPVGDLGAGPERAGLPEHGVDQGGLAVVHVRDDGHVAQFIAGGELSLTCGHNGSHLLDGWDCRARRRGPSSVSGRLTHLGGPPYLWAGPR